MFLKGAAAQQLITAVISCFLREPHRGDAGRRNLPCRFFGIDVDDYRAF